VAAVAGFPLAVLYIAQGGMAFLQLEVIVSIIFVLLYLYSAWPRSATLCFGLLVLHFGVWSWGFQKSDWPGWVLFWPGWNWVWHTGKSVSVVYPLLGFCT
jgi:hypothetical protein